VVRLQTQLLQKTKNENIAITPETKVQSVKPERVYSKTTPEIEIEI
jgi:hypothetical protein